jgi:hypothetical protein
MKIDHKPLDKVMKAWANSNEKPTLSKIYNVDDLFKDIPDNPDEILFKIPDEIIAEAGWQEGDEIEINSEGQTLVLKKKDVAVNKQST